MVVVEVHYEPIVAMSQARVATGRGERGALHTGVSSCPGRRRMTIDREREREAGAIIHSPVKS